MIRKNITTFAYSPKDVLYTVATNNTSFESDKDIFLIKNTNIPFIEPINVFISRRERRKLKRWQNKKNKFNR